MANRLIFSYRYGLAIAMIPEDQDKANKEDWYNIDIAKLPANVQEAYELNYEAAKQAKELRLAFEAAMKAHLGHKEQPKQVKPKQSLAEYLAKRAA